LDLAGIKLTTLSTAGLLLTSRPPGSTWVDNIETVIIKQGENATTCLLMLKRTGKLGMGIILLCFVCCHIFGKTSGLLDVASFIVFP
jgi:hypothetical protein